MKKQVLLAAAFLAVSSLPALAHHSFAAEFDLKQPITVKGVVTKIEWMNPHAWFYLDVKKDDGTVEHWQCETGAPVELVRRGWRKTDLKVGDEVTVQGLRAKDGTKTLSARMVTLPDGKKVFNGPAPESEPNSPPKTTGGTQ
jgi:hypothetical protein